MASVLRSIAAHSARSIRLAGMGMSGHAALPAAVVDAGAVRPGLIGTIGNTPLIHLRSLSEETGCTILGKAEFLNPGGSVKDRAALYLIKDAEERGAFEAHE